MRALVLAGGRGTRLRPLTDTRPKPMMPFMGEPYAVGLLRRLADAGVDHATFLIGADQVDGFQPAIEAGRGLGLTTDLEIEDEPLDTAGAARRVLQGSDEQAVLVCNGDMLTDVDYRALAERHAATGADATLAVKRVEDTSSYGVLVLDDDSLIQEFLEKPAPGTTDRDTVNAGAYVLDASAFDLFPGDGALSFEYDVFPQLVAEGRRVQGVELPAHWQDLGTPRRFLDGIAAVLQGTCDWPLAPGLEARDGNAVHRDAEVDPTAELEGVVVSHGCRVDTGARLQDTILLPGAHVRSGAHLTGSIVGAGAQVPEDHTGHDEVVPDAMAVA